jgi:hypothetical protein
MSRAASLSMPTVNLFQLFAFLDEHYCRLLGAYSRPDLEIELIHCEVTSAGTSALASRARPSLTYHVLLTIPFSRMGCVETVV